MMSLRPIILTAIVIVCVQPSLDGQLWGQDARKGTTQRARKPDFKQDKLGSVFFDNAFSKLVGERPGKVSLAPQVASGSTSGPSDAPREETAAAGSWSQFISAASLEDEVKALKLTMDKSVTTPRDFAGRGHKDARRDFTLLALIFGVIAEYDEEVRWKDSAATARDRFARVAANGKAGGSIQVYNEAKSRKEDLGELIRGSQLQPIAGQPEATWESTADRAPLMQLLEQRLEANVKQWTASDSTFEEQKESIKREAELIAMIGQALTREGMEDAGDEDYDGFAHALRDGGKTIVDALKLDNLEMAQKGVSMISRSCTDCHDSYR